MGSTIFLALTVAITSPPQPQPRTASSRHAWSVEVHAGGRFGAGGASGFPTTVSDAGFSYTTLTGQSTKAISAWLLNQGSTLFNSATGFPRLFPVDPSAAAGIAPAPRVGSSFGFRVARRMRDRLSLEMAVDVARSVRHPTPRFVSDVQRARDSYVEAFGELANEFGEAGFDNSASSVATFHSQTMSAALTGTINVGLCPSCTWAPFVLGGAGLVRPMGLPPGADIESQFQLGIVVGVKGPGRQREHEVIHVTAPERTRGVLVCGGGIERALNNTLGLRIDARVLVTTAGMSTLINTESDVLTGTDAGASFAISKGHGSLAAQFTNTTSSQAATSSLSNAPIHDAVVFQNTGLRVTFLVTAGVAFRLPW